MSLKTIKERAIYWNLKHNRPLDVTFDFLHFRVRVKLLGHSHLLPFPIVHHAFSIPCSKARKIQNFQIDYYQRVTDKKCVLEKYSFRLYFRLVILLNICQKANIFNSLFSLVNYCFNQSKLPRIENYKGSNHHLR